MAARRKRPTPRESADALLRRTGENVRALRTARSLTQAELAASSGLSPRFVSQIELGANVSVMTLVQVADAFGISLGTLLEGGGAADDAVMVEVRSMLKTRGAAEVTRALDTARALLGSQDGTRVALLGIRGAGKTTVGALLAKSLGAPFIELDARVEREAGMTIGSIFELHGEAHYRALERAALTHLLAEERSFVLATGGSIVTDPEQYDLLQRACTTVWLRATPEDHWTRVVAQGDARPMRENPRAMDELRALFASRLPLYERARIVVDTSSTPAHAVAKEIAARLRSPDGSRLSAR